MAPKSHKLPWPLSDDDLPSEVNYPVSKLKDINGWILSSQPTFQEETVAKDFYAVDRQSFVRADPTISMRVILSTCYTVSRTQDPVSRKNCCQVFLVVGEPILSATVPTYNLLRSPSDHQAAKLWPQIDSISQSVLSAFYLLHSLFQFQFYLCPTSCHLHLSWLYIIPLRAHMPISINPDVRFTVALIECHSFTAEWD